MNPTQLLNHFDRIGEAPDAILSLRKLILQLAVRGKLVEQNPREEPAVTGIDFVSKEAQMAIHSGIIRQHGLSKPDDNSGLLELPLGWRWTRLAEITRPVPYSIKRGPFGSAIRKDMFVAQGFKVYEQQHAISGDFTKGRYYITESKFEELRAFELHPNEILVSCSGTVGKVAIVPPIIERGIINQALLKLSLHQAAILNEYFLILFPAFYMETETLTNLQGTAQKNIPAVGVLREMPFPLPPLAEQHRIVAKVDELMALCDRLETAQTERESRRDRLVASSLHHLNNGSNADTFREHARFYFNHLPRLTTRPDHIKQLRQTILNLAVRGKLLPQDPTDEPADEMLARTMCQRQQKAREKGGKAPQPLLPISPDEVPYELPPGWVWEKLGNIGDTNIGLTYSPQDLSQTGMPVLRSSNIQNGKIDLSDLIRVAVEPKKSVLVELGDLLICARNGSRALVGKAALIERLAEKTAFGAFMAIFRSDFNRYLFQFICSPLFRQVISEVNTTTINQITQGNLRSTVAPIPPLAEQHRIVAKVDELMALCDQLETQLTTTQSESQKLMEAILHEALNPKLEKIA